MSDYDKPIKSITLAPEQKWEPGKEFKIDRVRWRNFPLWLLEDMMRVASMGEAKYGTYDFLQPNNQLTVNDHLDAAKRHMTEFEHPHRPDKDKESGVNHLYSAAWRMMVAAYIAENYPQKDDRFKGARNEKA